MGETRVLVRNPNSGDRKRSVRAAAFARERGYEVRDSTARGETLTLAREAAAAGADWVVACGGDGTLNEVVRGVADADALDDVTLGVVPAGTGNNFADRLGIRGVEHAFAVLERARLRRLDLGAAEDRLFVNSCVAGLTADASGRTTPEAKRRWGAMAYVLNTLREYRDFEGLPLDVRADEGGDVVWEGRAVCVLVGNGRRFVGEPGTQANMEDGLLNVVVVERVPAVSLVGDAAVRRLLRRGSAHLTRVTVPHLHVAVHDDEPTRFSLDGEMLDRTSLDVAARPGAMRFCVTDTYRAAPDGRGESKGV